jgi:hypothetical protein
LGHTAGIGKRAWRPEAAVNTYAYFRTKWARATGLSDPEADHQTAADPFYLAVSTESATLPGSGDSRILNRIYWRFSPGRRAESVAFVAVRLDFPQLFA